MEPWREEVVDALSALACLAPASHAPACLVILCLLVVHATACLDSNVTLRTMDGETSHRDALG